MDTPMISRDFPSRRQIILSLLSISLPLIIHAQNSAPTAQPIVDTIPEARDIARPGKLGVIVDATDVTRGIFHVKEVIPVTPGPLTLLYPKWLPGNHSATGPIPQL